MKPAVCYSIFNTPVVGPNSGSTPETRPKPDLRGSTGALCCCNASAVANQATSGRSPRRGGGGAVSSLTVTLALVSFQRQTRVSPFELNRPGKKIVLEGERAKSKIAPHGQAVLALVRRIFPPKAGILDRRRSLGVTILARKNCAFR
jgi:hypothetical protein